jgi:hemerythrin-like domain-containing protein
MGDITHNLKHEHRIIERALRALDGMCTRLEAGDAVPAESISELYEFLSIFGDRFHHGKEEKYLFPALVREGVAFRGGATDALVREHDMERKLISELERAVFSYGEGNTESRASFVKIARQYVDLMVEHFQKEDRALFKLANDFLDESAKEELSQNFKQAEVELGAASRHKYEQLAAQLEDRWAY